MNDTRRHALPLTYFLGATLAAALTIPACSSDDPATGGGGSGGQGAGGQAEGGSADGGGGGVSASCPSGLELCDGVCTAVATDEAHCGSCGNACSPGEVCDAGSCALSCPADQQICDADCVDTDVDPSHCGACDSPCNAGQLCDGSGSCALTCQEGLIDCDGKCIDPTVDPTHCGASATCQGEDAGVTCGANQACVDAECKALTFSKFVFVSSVTHDGNFGGLAGADAFCQGLADAAGLPGSYLAWLSDDTGTPASRFTQSPYPYVLVDGTIVADDWTDLTDGSLDHPIDTTELNGSPMPGSSGICGNTQTAWTNTTPSGTLFSPDYDCGEWTGQTGNYGSVWGRSDLTDYWSDWCGGGICTHQSSVYCFEQ